MKSTMSLLKWTGICILCTLFVRAFVEVGIYLGISELVSVAGAIGAIIVYTANHTQLFLEQKIAALSGGPSLRAIRTMEPVDDTWEPS
jgi:hypothetical protein